MQEPSVSDPVFTLTSGPVDAYPAVLRALSRTVLYDYDPAFLACYERVNEKAREALRTSMPPVILHGEPVLGLEAAAASLIARDDVVLNLASGVYGKGFGYWAKRYCAELVEIEAPYDEAIDPAQVAAAFEKRPNIKIVSVCHHDTPSGTINPVDEIGRIVAARGGYLLVDAVSSFGGMDVDPDACRADIFVTGPNKCLGCPPGLTLMGVSARAWEKMKANPDAPRASILSILDWEHAWRHDRPFPFTPSVAEINGFEAALDLYLAEGPEKVWARHALTAAACRAGVTAMGLSLWAAREAIASPTTTAVRVPRGIDDAALRCRARPLRRRLLFGPRRDARQARAYRPHGADTARPLYAIMAVTALGGALASLGHPVDVGTGAAAAMKVIDAAP
jgi:pyridoxamine--pyruvate transaminase